MLQAFPLIYDNIVDVSITEAAVLCEPSCGCSSRGCLQPVRVCTRSLQGSFGLPNGSDDELIPMPMIHWIDAPVLGSYTTCGFGPDTVTLTGGVLWIFGSFDNRACFNDGWCLNIGAWCSHTQFSHRVSLAGLNKLMAFIIYSGSQR